MRPPAPFATPIGTSVGQHSGWSKQGLCLVASSGMSSAAIASLSCANVARQTRCMKRPSSSIWSKWRLVGFGPLQKREKKRVHSILRPGPFRRSQKQSGGLPTTAAGHILCWSSCTIRLSSRALASATVAGGPWRARHRAATVSERRIARVTLIQELQRIQEIQIQVHALPVVVTGICAMKQLWTFWLQPDRYLFYLCPVG
jgi:hypothetical protein